MRLNCSQQAFLALVKAGIWGKDVELRIYGTTDFDEIMRFAEEQSVVGLVTAGLERVVDVKVPQEWVLQFIGETLQIEQQNQAMNKFVARLIDRLCQEDVYAILVKGQGIAQCYEKPLWRSSGDVDLLLSEKNYQRANQMLSPIATSVDEEIVNRRHIALTIDGWTVELHGSLKCGLWRNVNRLLDKVQNAVFYEGKVRSWVNERTQVFLPAPDEDVILVFSHILQHFFKEGVGLRQICDWCRLLWTYRDSIDRTLLESRIQMAGVISEWRAFAALATKYLGMPIEAMPLFNENDNHNDKLKRKADKIMEFVLECGNFGHNRDYSYYEKYPYVVFKVISLWRHITDTFRYFRIFPIDSMKVLWRKICVGVSVAIRGGRHE